MRLTAALVTAGLLSAAAAWPSGAQVPGLLPGSPPGEPVPATPLPGAVPPAAVVPDAVLPGAAPPPAVPGAPGQRAGLGRTAASGTPLPGGDQPAPPNPRVQDLERKSRDIDRRVMRSICSGC